MNQTAIIALGSGDADGLIGRSEDDAIRSIKMVRDLGLGPEKGQCNAHSTFHNRQTESKGYSKQENLWREAAQPGAGRPCGASPFCPVHTLYSEVQEACRENPERVLERRSPTRRVFLVD